MLEDDMSQFVTSTIRLFKEINQRDFISIMCDIQLSEKFDLEPQTRQDMDNMILRACFLLGRVIGSKSEGLPIE